MGHAILLLPSHEQPLFILLLEQHELHLIILQGVVAAIVASLSCRSSSSRSIHTPSMCGGVEFARGDVQASLAEWATLCTGMHGRVGRHLALGHIVRIVL